MEHTNSFSQPSSTAITAQIAFRDGGKGAFIGSHMKKIVLAWKEQHKDVIEGVTYDCVLKLMMKGNGYLVDKMVKAPTITARLYFRDGKKDLMISSYKEKIVLMPEQLEKQLQIQKGLEYRCEIVLTKNEKAYMVQSAEELPPASAEVVYQGYPVFMVDVKISGITDSDLSFDCSDAVDMEEKVIKDKIYYLKKRNLLEKESIAKEYEAACKKAMGEFNSRRYSTNMVRMKR
jgi:hypothetical protein